jgi:hypothetical protein
MDSKQPRYTGASDLPEPLYRFSGRPADLVKQRPLRAKQYARA